MESPAKIALTVVRVLIGATFLVAGLLKVGNPLAFAFEISYYRLLPWAACALLALYLPWLEIVAGVALLFLPAFKKAAGLTLLGMAFVFLVALISASARGLDISCGCFGPVDAGTGLGLAIFRVLVMVAGLFMILVPEFRKPRPA